jgi:hypothetical protein
LYVHNHSEINNGEDIQMTFRLTRIVLVLLLVIPIVRAQSAPRDVSSAEQKKAKAERDKQTLALVDEIIKEIRSLKLPENRIRMDIAIAGALWPRDEKRARLLFQEAVASFGEITASVESGSPEYIRLGELPQQLRQEILQIVVNHDPRLALDFLRATRPSQNRQTYPEAQLEMRLAIQIAAKDPKEALAAAEDSLRFGLDYEAMSLLNRFESADKRAGEVFLGDILNWLRTGDFNKSPASSYTALTLIRTWIENNRPPSNPPAQRTTSQLSLPNFDEATARELINIVLSATSSNGPTDSPDQLSVGQLTGTLQQLKTMLPDIERLVPNRIAALRSRIAESERFQAAQQGAWAKYNELIQSGSVEAMLEASKVAPPEIADNLVQQAASKALNDRDLQTASRIVEGIEDPRQRFEMKTSVDRQAFYIAREEKKMAEARALISRLPSVEERVMLLTQMASYPATEEDKAASLQLLTEAQALLGDRSLNYGQLQSQIEIAKVYERIDASRSIAIVEGVIDQVNELATAALVLDGFDVQGYFRSGEFIIFSGNPLNMVVQMCGGVLGSHSQTDFESARSTAERFARPEMRLIALSQIAQAALTSDSK